MLKVKKNSMHKLFKVINPIDCKYGQLKEDTLIEVVNDIIYVNGGQIMPLYYSFFKNIIQDELDNQTHTYIKEVAMIYNKC